MPNDSPFFLTRIECPICKTLNEFETIKMGAYIEEGRDTDFCPIDIKWRFPRYQGTHPLTFFAVTCNNCFYTREFTSNYKDWKNDNHFRTYKLKTIKTKHLDQLAISESVLKQLGVMVDISKHPNESAIVKLHLAIFDELLADHPSMLDLGRFYIRIGWVFRFLDGESESDGPNNFLSGLLVELENKFGSLWEHQNSSSEFTKSLKNQINSQLDHENLSVEIKSTMLPFKERFENQILDIEKKFESCSDEINKLSELISEYKTSLLGTELSGGSSFGIYPSFSHFLSYLKNIWPEIVTDENQALRKAIHYYIQALEDGRTISKGNQQIQASFLIAELSRWGHTSKKVGIQIFVP
ncbi:MAG: DUF2225 domain-containing protein [Promethearchaeota archaeon]